MPWFLPSPNADPSPLPDAYGREDTPSSGFHPLDRDVSAQVAIVGGGITGLSAALHLAEAGIGTVVLERGRVAHGASGRAFGNVVPYAKHPHDHILKRFGPEIGQRVVDTIASGPDVVYGLVERLGIDCAAVRNGLIFAAHTPDAERALHARADYWQSRGGAVEMLDAAETERLTGTRYYDASLIDHRGGTINPLAYTRGLGDGAARAGATLCEDSAVTDIERRPDGWRLRTAGGTVDAETVLLCANAYVGDLHRAVARSFVPMRAYQLVSRPLSPNLTASILPGGQTLTDTRRLFSGIRVLPGGRLHVSADGPIFGGAGAPYEEESRRRIEALYPDIGSLDWEEAWTGWVAVTRDEYPRVHELADGLWTAYGYGGRGIAFGTLLGRQLAAQAAGGDPAHIFFPVTRAAPIFGHLFARPALNVFMSYLRWRDRRDLARSGRAV